MKRNIFLWSLYDFANSILMIVFLFYFSQWLVIDSGKPDWWYNLTLIGSSIIFMIIAPFMGRHIDMKGKKLAGVRVTTAVFLSLYIATSSVMLFAPSQALLATILFTFSMGSYLLSFVYYTPMINDLSNETNRGWISGLGQGANYLGQVFGILVSIPFATGIIYWFGSAGRPQTLLPAVILFIITALPLLIFYKEPVREKPIMYVNSSKVYLQIWDTLKKIFSIRNLALLLVAYFLSSDALLTFSNNFPIFLEKSFGVGDDIKSYITAGILTLSIIGSIVMGKISDKKGHKRTLLWILGIWIILFPLLAFAPSFNFALVIMLIGGFLFAPVWGISRAMMSDYTPRDIEGSAFGFYVLAERFATLVGPIMWSLILIATPGEGANNYSYAILGMGILMILSWIIVKKIR